MQKITAIGPAGAPRQWGEISCSNVFFIYFFFDFLRSSGDFWEYRHRFCVKRRVPVGTDFLGGSQLQDQTFSPPKAPKT